MIVALTPNLAIDRTSRLDRAMQAGNLQRTRSTRESAGGKGVNLARTVRALGGTCVVAGFLAGHNGRKFGDLLARDGLEGIFHQVDGETRECHIFLDPSGAPPTEVNERGPVITQGDWETLLGKLPNATLVIAGSLPPIADVGFAMILERLESRTIVDSSGDALRAAVARGVALIKPNRGEFEQLVDALPTALDPSDAEAKAGFRSASAGERREAYAGAARAIQKRWGTSVLLTLGVEGALLIDEGVWYAASPKVEVTNPVGSGDALLGAFLWARERGEAPERALRIGVAAGADNARRGGGGAVTREGVERLAEAIRVESVG